MGNRHSSPAAPVVEGDPIVMKGRPKILLITPPYHAGVVESAGRWMPLSFVYLAGAARAGGYDAEIYDAMTKQHGLKDIEARVKVSDADFVGVTAITSSLPASLEVLRLAKRHRPEVRTILGGVHPTFCSRELLEVHADILDFVVCGEGERTLPALMKAVEEGTPPDDVRGIAFARDGNVITTPPRRFVEDLDALPTAWDAVTWEDYRYFVIPGSRLAAISTSRGCTHGCTFCSQQRFWEKQWRARSPKSVVQEMTDLKRHYGANVFLIVDEYPTRDRARWEEFLDRLMRAHLDVYVLMETRVEDIVRDADIMWKYRSAGIVHIYVGVEATNQATLDLVKKDISVEQSKQAIDIIHAHRMISETSFVLGFPWETSETIADTLALAQHYNPDFAHFLAITPWPYADIHAEMADFIEERDYGKYNLVEPVIRPARMTLEQVRRAMLDCYRQYYMRKAPEYFAITDSFKREYLRRSMHLIMRNSFLSTLMAHTGRTGDFNDIHQLLSQANTGTIGFQTGQKHAIDEEYFDR